MKVSEKIELLKKKLQRIDVGDSGHYYYNCGEIHDRCDHNWNPFGHIWAYTERKQFDFHVVKDLIAGNGLHERRWPPVVQCPDRPGRSYGRIGYEGPADRWCSAYPGGVHRVLLQQRALPPSFHEGESGWVHRVPPRRWLLFAD